MAATRTTLRLAEQVVAISTVAVAVAVAQSGCVSSSHSHWNVVAGHEFEGLRASLRDTRDTRDIRQAQFALSTQFGVLRTGHGWHPLWGGPTSGSGIFR